MCFFGTTYVNHEIKIQRPEHSFKISVPDQVSLVLRSERLNVKQYYLFRRE